MAKGSYLHLSEEIQSVPEKYIIDSNGEHIHTEVNQRRRM
jgi:hypothetical protein